MHANGTRKLGRRRKENSFLADGIYIIVFYVIRAQNDIKISAEFVTTILSAC